MKSVAEGPAETFTTGVASPPESFEVQTAKAAMRLSMVVTALLSDHPFDSQPDAGDIIAIIDSTTALCEAGMTSGEILRALALP